METKAGSPEAGIYSLYLAGSAGNGFGLIMLKGGIITGSDSTGTLFDGNYTMLESMYIGSIVVKVPAGGNIIQGTTVPPQGLIYQVDFRLPESFEQLPYVRLPTPYGDINVKFVKLRAM